MFCVVSSFFLGCVAGSVGFPEYSYKSDPGLLVGRSLRMMVVAANLSHCCCSSFRSVLWQCRIWS